MRSRVSGWLILWLFLLCLGASAEWYPFRFHLHTTSSNDGTESPKRRIEDGIDDLLRGIGVTDHYCQIGGKADEAVAIERFRKYADSLTSEKIVVLAGAEFASFQGEAASHFWAVGPKPIGFDPVLRTYCGKGGSQQNLINRLRNLGFVVIAAHPSLVKFPSQEVIKGKPSNHLFDWDHAEGINGVEFFNDGTPEAFENTFVQFQRLAAEGKRVAAIGGADQHATVDPKDSERAERRTYLWMEGEPTAEKAVQAMLRGETAATALKAWLMEMTPHPGPEINRASEPVIHLFVHICLPLRESHKVTFYRDRTSLGSFTIRRGASGFTIDLKDKKAPPGRHFYMLKSDFLVTSPVWFEVPSR